MRGLSDKSIYILPCFICSCGLRSRLPIQACLPGKPSVTKENSHSLRWDWNWSWRWGSGGLCSSMFRLPRVEGNPAVAWRVAPRLKRSRVLRSRRGVTAPRQPRGVGGVSASSGGRVASPASTVSHRFNFPF